MEAVFEYVFPAIRGIQARREYYTSMCPLRLINKLFLFDDEELLPEIRAQRTLNRSRVPEIARYVTANPENYVFSAITASVDADVRFEPLGAGREGQKVGLLHIPMSARFVINDGQHRRAAIECALRERPELGDETIAVVFFLDLGLERSQQMFADLNRHAVRPSRSLGVLYDHRDDLAQLAKLVVFRSALFRGLVEMERSTLSPRSRRLFTLSAIYTATSALVKHQNGTDLEGLAALAVDFWETIATQFQEWEHVRTGAMTAGEVRRDFIHSHAVVLQAIGNAGAELLQRRGDNWLSPLRKLRKLDWSRANARLWEGRAIVGGAVAKASNNVTLTGNVIKQHLGLPLSAEEQRIETAFREALA
jgi:DNA sulfur modification protein DndB